MGAVFAAMSAALLAWGRDWLQILIRHLSASDYLAGSLAMSFIAVARDAVASFWRRFIVTTLRERLWVNIQLYEKEADLLLAWLRERPEIHAAPSLALFSRGSGMGNKRIFEYEPEMQTCTRLRIASRSTGRKRWMWITQKSLDVDDHGSSRERRLRRVTVSFLGRDKAELEDILEQGREIQRRKREKHLTVVQVYDYGKEHGLDWLHPQETDRKQPGRSISSVVLPRLPGTSGPEGLDQAEAMLEDAREFLASEAWYTERGIPYRRGYLLHGVPGGGKSSLIVAAASELRLPIYMLQLSSELMNDEMLNALLQHGMHDPPTILLLEDVDLLHTAALRRDRESAGREGEDSSALVAREDEDEKPSARGGRRDTVRMKKGGRLTLSGLLNALDGPTATTGRLLFLTTNARDRLDPALLRSGRIDYEIEFTTAQPEQVERLFTRFYSDFAAPALTSAGGEHRPGAQAEKPHGGAPPLLSPVAKPLAREASGTLDETQRAELATAFAEKLAAAGAELTTADIQRHLLKHKKDPHKAIAELPSLIQLVGERKTIAPNGAAVSSGARRLSDTERRGSASDGEVPTPKTPKGSRPGGSDAGDAGTPNGDARTPNGAETPTGAARGSDAEARA